MLIIDIRVKVKVRFTLDAMPPGGKMRNWTPIQNYIKKKIHPITGHKGPEEE
jgi:hypothetical protein